MSTAIRIEGLGKRYDINRGGATNSSIRDVLTGLLRRRSLGSEHKAVSDGEAAAVAEAAGLAREFWALRDISLDIAEGERIGIIGANGAGKSTLLKILSRVTAPTEGRVEIHGKVASLLEVGTGFHPELSGRENVYLNGAILGMSHAEIRRKFDQIVDFSGVSKFLDTPVKHYSSGMYVRLAFSVSAWLDPDILIVDEVLAVGDQAFQKKCAERMKELTKEGRTVLFVSHSMATVNQMCQKALYLEAGRVLSFGPVAQTTIDYNRDVIEQVETEQIELPGRGNATAGKRATGWRWHRATFTLPDASIEVATDYPGKAECLGGSIATEAGHAAEKLPIHKDLHVTVRYRLTEDLGTDVVSSINFYDEMGTILFVAMADKPSPGAKGDYTTTCILPAFLLNTGRFTANLNLSDFRANSTTYFAVATALRFEIVEDEGVDPRRNGFILPLPGYFRAIVQWINETPAVENGRPGIKLVVDT